MDFFVLIALGLATWIGTSVIVEAEIFRDVREAFDWLHNRYDNWLTYKLRYLIQCHMCTGIWVAAIVSLLVPPVIGSGFVGWGLTALAIKGVAHLFLVLHKLGDAYTSKAEALAHEQLEFAQYYSNSSEYQDGVQATESIWTDCLSQYSELNRMDK